MFNFSKRIATYISIVIAVLFIPMLAMQFTDEVKWTLFDFFMASFLLITTLTLVEITLRNFKNKTFKITTVCIILFLFLLIWGDLSVGIF
jgi:multidrug efflux pump subunit AcrB